MRIFLSALTAAAALFGMLVTLVVVLLLAAVWPAIALLWLFTRAP